MEGGTYTARVMEEVWFLLQLLHIGRNSRKELSGANEKQGEEKVSRHLKTATEANNRGSETERLGRRRE